MNIVEMKKSPVVDTPHKWMSGNYMIQKMP
jgi:hypothetical protein